MGGGRRRDRSRKVAEILVRRRAEPALIEGKRRPHGVDDVVDDGNSMAPRRRREAVRRDQDEARGIISPAAR